MTDKNDYLNKRYKLVHKLNRHYDKESRYDKMKSDGVLSKYGYQELGRHQGETEALESAIDMMDELFGIEWQKDIQQI